MILAKQAKQDIAQWYSVCQVQPPAPGDKKERKKRGEKKDWQSRVCKGTWVVTVVEYWVQTQRTAESDFARARTQGTQNTPLGLPCPTGVRTGIQMF